MNSGPIHGAASPPLSQPELPGEFVSEQLRSDCARFLDEQRRLLGLRRESPPESSAWVPGRSEGRHRPAGSSPPS
jgi:hypothetical protein